MKIGIIFAMKEELDEVLVKVKKIKEHKIYDLIIYECNYNNITCYLVESGIGKVNAARTTQIIISEFKIDYILNVGVAGSVSKDADVCDIVIADKLVQHDYDLTAFNREKGFIPNVGKFIDCDKELLDKSKQVELDTNIVIGTVASGDIFVSEDLMSKKINTKFGALCVEMEGAAIAQVCHLCKIPFIVIRSISDSVYKENNTLTYDEFLVKSSKTIADFTLNFLNKM